MSSAMREVLGVAEAGALVVVTDGAQAATIVAMASVRVRFNIFVTVELNGQ
jgi:hypothetical protein